MPAVAPRTDPPETDGELLADKASVGSNDEVDNQWVICRPAAVVNGDAHAEVVALAVVPECLHFKLVAVARFRGYFECVLLPEETHEFIPRLLSVALRDLRGDTLGLNPIDLTCSGIESRRTAPATE